jgi:NTE family protein
MQTNKGGAMNSRVLHGAFRIPGGICIALCVLAFFGCNRFYAYTNDPLLTTDDYQSKASFEIKDDRGSKDVLLMLALSGGGSRAAYFSSLVMFELGKTFTDLDILKEVDVISSVSGGSLPAAYYAISKDEAFTLRTQCALSCSAFGEMPNILCNENEKSIGFKNKAVEKEKNVLLRACPDEWQKIERLYKVSRYDVKSNRPWNEDTVQEIMSRNYILRWVGNWFWPANVARYWFTAYDRSDIMAQTFQDNLYDVYPLGFGLNFADLNPERPYLILNATDGTEYFNGKEHFGEVFTFTKEDFRDKINSDINRYSIARAVMGSSAFPAAFNYITLADFTEDPRNPKSFIHVFDGGTADNLGLTSLSRVINKTQGRYKHYIVILVDSFIKPTGKSSKKSNPRDGISYILDTNFLDGIDSLLNNSRDNLLWSFVEEHRDKLTFWHLTFEKLCPSKSISDIDPEDNPATKRENLRDALYGISTDFKISGDDKLRIKRAVELLFKNDGRCLDRIRDILLGSAVTSVSDKDDPCDTSRILLENPVCGGP